MSDWKKLSSTEWGAPFQGAGPLGGIEQRDKDTSVAAVLERDEITQVEGLDIHEDARGSIDNAAAKLEAVEERAGDAKAAEEAAANQR